MKVSIITTPKNADKTIEETIRSVLNQSYRDIEYIIVDGVSDDGTMGIIDRYKGRIARIISESDRSHFEAKNKGLALATGDIVGFLNADDFYADKEAIEKIVKAFVSRDVDCVWADVVYIGRDNEKVIRYWKSCAYKEDLFKNGWMPPHPSFFAKRWVYEKYGYFNTDFRIAADYDIMLRFLHTHRLSHYYLPEMLVKMRIGGISNGSLRSMTKKTIDDYNVLKANNFNGIPYILFLKHLTKIPQFFMR